MANSSYIQCDAKFGYVRLSWNIVSQSIENNTSTLNYALSIYRESTWSSEIGKDYWIKIDGKIVSEGKNILGGKGKATLRSGTVVIEHNEDGTRSVEMGFSQKCDVTWSGDYIGVLTKTETVELDDVPHPTVPTVSGTTLAMDSEHTISLPRKKSTFTHNLTVTFGKTVKTIATNVGESVKWKPLTSDYAPEIPKAVSGSATLSCETYDDGKLIGVRTLEIILSIPSTVVPVFNSPALTVTETITGAFEKFGAFIQNVSEPRIEVFANGVYGSTITNYEITFDERKYNGQSVTCEKIWQSGQLTVSAIVTDSRGRTAEARKTVNVLPYLLPTISTFTVVRSSGDKAENPDGTRLYVKYVFQISALNNLNDKNYVLAYKETGSENWTTITTGSTYSGNSDLVTNASIVFDVDKTYQIKLTLEDYFSTIEKVLEISTAFTLVDFNASGKGIAFGKVSEHDYMEIGMPVKFTKGVLEETAPVPTLQNGWGNYGGEYNEANFYKSFDGIVRISGVISGGTRDSMTILFVLPEGYRPRGTERFMCASMGSPCAIDVCSSGEVLIPFDTTENVISLSGIAFKQYC